MRSMLAMRGCRARTSRAVENGFQRSGFEKRTNSFRQTRQFGRVVVRRTREGIKGSNRTLKLQDTLFRFLLCCKQTTQFLDRRFPSPLVVFFNHENIIQYV